jgi:ABC-type polysaccharide/polyol phosphate transport system ATPase subunit
MAHMAISIDHVSKAFKKHQRRKHFLTIKSTMVRDFWNQSRGDDDLFWALQDIDFDVESGETLGLIGSNGSGKSTLLKLVAGILKPSSGSIQVNGRLSALIELGAGFHPEISGRENVYINGIMLGLSRQEIIKKFDEIVDFAELWDFIDNPVRTYSSGMFMRLGFAVAVHVNPEILLIDEVLAVGDQSFVHKCLERIFDFKRRKKTIVMVSHDLSAVEKLCSRVIWLSQGQKKMSGASREVIDAYLMSVAKKEEQRYATQHQQVIEPLDKIIKDGSDPENKLETNSVESAASEKPKNRWGTREVEITHLKLYDNDRQERYVFKTGESVTMRIEYLAKKKIEKPVFGIGFFLQDGTWCYGSNTHLEKWSVESIEGAGWVELRFPELSFLENTYLIDVAVHAIDGTPYDYHSRLYTIAFRSEIKDSGIMRSVHNWTFSPELKVTSFETEELDLGYLKQKKDSDDARG